MSTPVLEQPNAESAAGEWTASTAWTLALLTAIYALNYLDRQILSLVLPLIKAELHISDTVSGLVTGAAFVLFYSILGIPIARLADRASRRNIIAVGCAFWSAMTAATGLVSNVWQLALTRFLMGAGEACGIAPSNSMLADLFSSARRPFALSIMTAGNGLGALLFFPIIGWIAQHYGWRTTFAVAGGSGLLVTLLFVLSVAEPVRRSGPSSVGEPHGFTAALAFLSSSKTYVLILAGGAFMGISLYSNLVWNSSFLVRVHGFNMTQIGSTLGPIRGLCSVAGTVLGGLLTARLGQRDARLRLWVPGIACILVLPAEVLFLVPTNVAASLVGLALASLLAVVHLGPVYAACLSIATPASRATACAVFLLVANLIGQIIGPVLVGALNDYWQAAYGALAIRYSMLVGAACAAVGGLFFLAAARHVPADQSSHSRSR